MDKGLSEELFEMLTQLLIKDRSVRRFDNSKKVSRRTLLELVGLTRYCASGRNLQPLRYYIADTEQDCEMIFPHLAWAGYYKDWAGPAPSERPAAYIIQCLDTSLTSHCLCDDGLHLQAITLGATALGVAGCIIKAFNAAAIAEALKLPESCKPLYVYALGVAAEEVAITEVNAEGDIRYYRDSHDRQCVPKRSAQDLVIN